MVEVGRFMLNCFCMPVYCLFLDESGHHGLKTINQEFPILLLCGCIFEKSYFEKNFTESFNKLKLKYFDTTEIIFHSRDIRKWQRNFKILGDIKLRHEFYKDLNKLIANADFKIIAAAILKDKLIKEFGPRSDNPYDLSLTFILENTLFYLDTRNLGKVIVVVEARGKREDSSLQNQYQLVLSHGTDDVSSKKFTQIFTDLDFVKKKENNLGTQLCDLVAYPLATKILYPERKNLAFDVVQPKIHRQFPEGDYLGYGLKIFP